MAWLIAGWQNLGFERKHPVPVVLHVHHSPTPRRGFSQRHLQLAHARRIVRELADRVRMVYEQSKAGPITRGGPLQHLQIAVRVTKRRNGPAPDVHVDAHRLADVIVHKIQLWQPRKHRHTVNHLKLGYDAAANHLLRRYPIDLLREDAHEFDSPAGDDKRLESIGS